jgi:transposase-like protein
MYLKISGNLKYLYAIMDDETRFWIAQQVAHTKYTEDVRPLFKDAKEIAGKRPMTLISDGARNFEEACRKECFTMAMPKTKHVRHIHISGDKNNNKRRGSTGD